MAETFGLNLKSYRTIIGATIHFLTTPHQLLGSPWQHTVARITLTKYCKTGLSAKVQQASFHTSQHKYTDDIYCAAYRAFSSDLAHSAAFLHTYPQTCFLLTDDIPIEPIQLIVSYSAATPLRQCEL